MNFSCITVLCCYIVYTFGRPSHVLQDYNNLRNIKENTYEDNASAASDELSSRNQMMRKLSGNTADSEVQDIIDSNTSDEADHQQSDKEYFEDNNRNEVDSAQQLSRNMSPLNDISKRTVVYDTLFQNNARWRKNNENNYNNDETGTNDQVRYIKQYQSMHPISGLKKCETIEDVNVSRDKRQLLNLDSSNESIRIEKSNQKNGLHTNEDEETAIRRHIKKLSKQELDELFNSLSEDKSALLRSIIDSSSQQDAENVNKREITKKAGTIEDNNSLVSNGISDSSKIQGGPADIDESSISPNSDNTDNTKKADMETMSSKTSETSSSQKSSDKTRLSSVDVDDVKLEKSEKENVYTASTDSKLLTDAGSGVQISKNEKREINVRSVNSEDLINNEDCYENDDEPHLSNKDSELYERSKIAKRDIFISDSDLSDSLKSLEESFPNIDDSMNCNSLNDMAPLVRVKRMKPIKSLNKRDISLSSNIKVPFFSNALDNIEEDTDGGEFHDDGFFDRSYVKSGEISKVRSNEPNNDEENQHINSGSQSADVENHNLEPETVKLGSDSDNVISGIEGVDDNIMLNNALRTRRTAHNIDEFDNSMHEEIDKNILSNNKNSELVNEASECSNGAPHYQENDAFGSLPRNYDEDLGRFKRIRRLKPSLGMKNNESMLN